MEDIDQRLQRQQSIYCYNMMKTSISSHGKCFIFSVSSSLRFRLTSLENDTNGYIHDD